MPQLSRSDMDFLIAFREYEQRNYSVITLFAHQSASPAQSPDFPTQAWGAGEHLTDSE